MRAIAYYAKYSEGLLNAETGKETATNMIGEFLDEMKELIETRHIKTDRGAVGCVRELNEKWNAIVAIFEKRNGASPLIRNGFRAFMEEQIPALKNVPVKLPNTAPEEIPEEETEKV